MYHALPSDQRPLYQVPSITATQLHDLLQGPSGRDVIMVDTRTDEERAVSRIPGTVLSKEEFEGQKANFRNKTVVAYCTGMLHTAQRRSDVASDPVD